MRDEARRMAVNSAMRPELRGRIEFEIEFAVPSTWWRPYLSTPDWSYWLIAVGQSHTEPIKIGVVEQIIVLVVRLAQCRCRIRFERSR